MMYAREIPKLSPKKPSKNGAPAMAIPAASDDLPIAKSGRLSLKLTKRIAANANCIEIPKPITKRQMRLMIIEWDSQNATKPKNCNATNPRS